MSSAETAPIIKIFRPGTFTSVEGTEVSLGEADLQAIASAYDPAKDPAPLVIGHPKIDAPAYGWVKSLSVDDGFLVAHPDQIEPSFAELVREGRYKKVSAQFYPPKHPANPQPGSWSLKHVGFLGAHAPGVKGLGTVSLAAGDVGELVTIDFPEPPANAPDKQESPMPDTPKDDAASFAERQAELDARETALDEKERKLAKDARDARHADHVSFAESLISEAKLAPAGKGLLVGLLDHLGEATDVASFGEADGDKMAPAAALKKLLSSATPLVSLGEMAKGGAKGEEDPADLADVLAREAASFVEAEAKAGRTITVAAAVRHIQKQKGVN